MKYETETIKEIDLKKEEIENLMPLTIKFKRKLDKKYRLEFNYNSNHLEGNTLSYGQTELLLFFDKVSGDLKLSDVEEMKAHDVALSMVEEMAKDDERPLTETFIKELNKIILVRPFWKEAVTHDGISTRKRIEIGEYKKMPNSVRLRSGEIHEYASPTETPAKMNELLDWYRRNSEIMHPVQLAIEFHYKFVCIHPFDDGNGRVARLLMNYILLDSGYPIVIIKSEDKENYLTALQKADTGDLLSMIEYHENQLLWSLNLKLKAARQEELEETGDLEKEIELLKRQKLSNAKTHYTPKIAFELIKHIDSEIWEPILSMLGKFDDFFSETKVEMFVNQIKVEKKVWKRNPLRALADRLETIGSYEIFGYNLEDQRISEITWEKQMLSLKSINKKVDYFFNCSIELKDSNYQLVFKELNTDSDSFLKNTNVLYDEELNYNYLFMQSDIEETIKKISKHFLEIIKAKE